MARRVDDHRKRPPDLEFEFSHDDGAPRRARAAIRTLISAEGDPIADDVETVTSELVANVIRHTNGGGTLKAWEPAPDVPLRLEVEDEGQGLPEPVPLANAPEVGGRGLRIVNDIADAWGVQYLPGAKKVWAEFDRDARSNPHKRNGVEQ